MMTESERLGASDFHSLGIRDLLDARDQFHVHLAHKPNVFSTAIGRYLIRDSDRDAHEAGIRQVDDRARKSKERTLLNSKVQRWSWPCILVFVKRWQTLDDLVDHPEDVVPPFIYMPDGRTVPVCVVLAGALGIGTQEAEARKREQPRACLPHAVPWIERIANSIRLMTAGAEDLPLHLAGGALMLPGADEIIASYLGRETVSYPHALLITPLGIARSAP